MDLPRARAFTGRAKWGEVAGNLVLAALGAGLASVVFAAVPADVVPMRMLAWYTVAAVVATLALAIALAATRRLPGLREAEVEGAPALVARSWRGEWWHATALDAGLVVLAGVLTGLGLWQVAPVGAWFLVRVALTLTGRRRNEGLWLTATEVGHDAAWGRERVRREQVTRVRSIGGTSYLLLRVEGEVHRELCPRPWRRRRTTDDSIVVRCAWLGPEADDLAAWLRAELGLEAAQGFGRAATGSHSPGDH
ncbi:hypothetical protein [Nocardioides sp. URHA0020]|uniref:hypothetical protein n=1 Tax=Nocardioides sp. URHA0020 TaxID=1380392 RepID=UPI00048B893B|nr:hypothetical protein [Nocardioides sp. URHA0020]